MKSFLGKPLTAALVLLPLLAFAQTPERPGSERGALILQTPIVGLWLMGQSLCDGSESLPIVTTQDTGWGNLAFRRGVRTWLQADHGATPEQRAKEGFEFVPLKATANGGLGETIANGLADHLKATLFKLSPSQAKAKTAPPHFLVAYAGQGGRMIEELALADESADPRTPAVKQAGGGYYKTSLDDARRATQRAKAEGKAFQIGALVWMQGEANGGPTGGIVPARWKDELPRPAGQEWYRDRLIAYRQQWSDDLRAITGQAGEIPLFTYQTLGPAGEAQLMAADRDPHIVMVGPHYMVPSALNSRYGERHGAAIHLSADGERWYGEQVAKVVHRTLVEGEDWQPLRPRKAWTDAARTSVWVDMIVPRPPLVLDETFFPRQQSESGGGGGFTSLCGFQIRSAKGAGVILTAVAVEPPARVRLQLAHALPDGDLFLINYGVSQAGKLGVIEAIRRGPVNGAKSTTELVVSGSMPARLKPLLAEGAFNVASQAGTAYAQATIRLVREDKDQGVTVLRYNDDELRNQVPFAVGQTLIALRFFSYGNLRDSDAETAVHSFADKAYGTRAGQPYPLWNWCVLFDRLPVSAKE